MAVIINHPVESHIDPSVHFDLLWENPDPTSNFSAKTIALDLRGYSAVKIAYTPNNGSSHSGIGITELPIGADTNINGVYYRMVRRTVQVTETGITFGGGQRYDTYASSSTSASDSDCVPLKIWGIR